MLCGPRRTIITLLPALTLAHAGWAGAQAAGANGPDPSNPTEVSVAPRVPVVARVPAPADPWDATVQALARALSQGDPALLGNLLGHVRAVSTLDAKSGDPVRLLARTAGGTPLFARGYTGLPLTFASDLSRVLAAAPGVPAEVQKLLAVRDEAQAKQANAVAARWVAEVLGARDRDAVGVIALWCERPATSVTETRSELVFVLVKGDSATGGPPKVRMLAFGEPQSGR